MTFLASTVDGHPLRPAWAADEQPRILPPGWLRMKHVRVLPGWWYQHESGLRVCSSAWPAVDGKRWLHVSMARVDRMPSYDDMYEAKGLFCGRERKALQVFPTLSEHYSAHPFCLHLWCAIDGDDGLPDFRILGGI